MTTRRASRHPVHNADVAFSAFAFADTHSRRSLYSLLVAQYEALSLLLSQGWQPRRTVVLAHGFDEEEVNARQGAGHIAPWLEEKYGHDSMLMIIDEGSGSQDIFGTNFALPATGEKGYLDVGIRVGTPGGHSSVPPPHTAIGITSEIIAAIEAKPHKPNFSGLHDPFMQFMACASEHADQFPPAYKKAMNKRDWKSLANAFAATSRFARGKYSACKLYTQPARRRLRLRLCSLVSALISTTQAIDTISGGLKVNALPEVVYTVM